MKKFYQIYAVAAGTDPTVTHKTMFFSDIDAAAKQITKNKIANERQGYRYDYYILEAVKVAKVPEPQPAELVDLE